MGVNLKATNDPQDRFLPLASNFMLQFKLLYCNDL